MKIIHVETLIEKGNYPERQECADLRAEVHAAVKTIDWPVGSGTFTIYPVKQQNGVVPIKEKATQELEARGWQKEYPWPLEDRKKPGRMDAGKLTPEGLAAFEWETGNISSSHRSLNKMCMGLMQEIIIAGFLIVPSRALYTFLTDRIGNFSELVPYLPLWKSVPVQHGLLEIIVIEQDAESMDVPKIPKGTDGRALG